MARVNARKLVRLSTVVGLSLAAGLWIAFAQIRLFPSILNKCAIAHPWLLYNGFVDYQHIPGQKSPLMPMFLSWLLPVFNGDAALSARTTHAAVICFVVLITMLWVYRHSGRWALLATGVFLLTWSNFFGLWAIMYYDVALAPLFLVVFVLSATQLEKPATWKMAATGLVTGVAILTKQHAVLLPLPIAIMLVWQLRKRQVTARQLVGLGLTYLLGLALPVVIYVVYHYLRAGSLQDLIYWTITVNFGPYGSEAALAPDSEHVRDMLPALLMLIPFAGSIVFPTADMKPSREVRLLMLAMFFLGAVLLYPRYSTRHWPTAFPFLAAMSGIACADLIKAWRKHKASSMALIAASIILCWTVIAALVYAPRLQEIKPLRSDEYSGFFEVADQLRGRIPAEGGVVLLPLYEGNANLSYALGRLPPHYWLFNFRWWMNPTTIGRWLEVMEQEKPYTLLFFPDTMDLDTYAPEIMEYVNKNYKLVDTLKWGNSRQIEIMFRSPTGSP